LDLHPKGVALPPAQTIQISPDKAYLKLFRAFLFPPGASFPVGKSASRFLKNKRRKNNGHQYEKNYYGCSSRWFVFNDRLFVHFLIKNYNFIKTKNKKE